MIINSYPEHKRQSDRYKSFVYYFLRPVSFPVTYVLLKLGISANATTSFSIIMETIGCILIAFGGYPARIGGTLLIMLWAILDCVDGNIARFRKTGTLSGIFIDDFGAIVLYALLYLSVGISATANGDGFLWQLIMGALSSIFAILRWVVNFNYKITLLNNGKKNEKFFGSYSSVASFSKFIYVNISTFGGLVLPLLLLFTLSNTLHIFNIIYFIINAIVFVSVLFVTLKRLSSFKGC
jgi:hypothetical protein